MDLGHLEVLVAVAEEKGFSRAAHRLHRTQPAVSQTLRRLEAEVGAPLVDRSSKDGTLTDTGRVLYGYAQQLLRLRRTAKEALEELNHLGSGVVTIAANEYTVLHLLPIVARFRQLHPQVRIEVKRSLASRIPSEVLGREVELGLVTYGPAQPGLKAVAIATDELALLVPPRHRLAGRAEVSVRELGGEQFLAHNVRSPWRERVVQLFERQRTPLRIVMELPTLEAIRRLVADGLGVALMPRHAAGPELASRALVAIRVREVRFERPVLLVWRSGARLSHAASGFLDCARVARARAPEAAVRPARQP